MTDYDDVSDTIHLQELGSGAIEQRPQQHLVEHYWVTVWLLDSLCEAGYVFERE